MKKIFNIILATISLMIIGALVRLYTPIVKDWGATHCDKPLYLIASVDNPQNFSATILNSFNSDIKLAIDEWNQATEKSLFILTDSDSMLSRSGLVSKIILTPQTTGKMLGLTLWNISKDGVVDNFTIKVFSNDPDKFYEIVLHELAHARGLEEHSPNKNDVLYKEYNPNLKHLSENDIRAMINYCNMPLN